MTRIIYSAILTMFVVSSTGCSRDFGDPYVSPGPTPLSGNGTVTRYQRTKHHFSIGEIHEVWWGVGGKNLAAKDHLQCLIDALPQRVIDKLRETRPEQTADGYAYEKHLYWADATVVSVQPYLLVVCIGEYEGDKYPFEQHDGITPRNVTNERLEFIREHREWITAGMNNKVRYHAGSLVPYSEHITLVTCGNDAQDIASVSFEEPVTILKLGDLELRFTRDGDDILVDRL